MHLRATKFNLDIFTHPRRQTIPQANHPAGKPSQVSTNTFTNVANKHAPLKKKIIRGNDAPFMTKELRKAIMNRSRSKHKYLKILLGRISSF